jgi:hypothetical protein
LLASLFWNEAWAPSDVVPPLTIIDGHAEEE